MWLLASLFIALISLPTLAFAQAIDQRKVGLYQANISGSDCSQATLEAADDAALAAGRALWITPTNRAGVACQWIVSSNLTIDSPVYIPYKSTPTVQVADNITLTLQECPYTDGDYFIIDANEDTTGNVNYASTCTRCAIAGANNWIQCLSGDGGAGSGATTLPELTDVNANVDAADDTFMIGGGTDYAKISRCSCNPATEKCIYDPDTNTESCVTDVSGGTTLFDAAFDADTGELDSVLCGTKPFKTSNAGDDFWEECVNVSGVPRKEATCDGLGCDQVLGAGVDRNWILHDFETATDMLTVDADAASRNAMWQLSANYQWLVSATVILRPSGDCSFAEESIVTDDPLDGWITCTDIVGDAVSFSYPVTTKIAGDTTAKITMIAVNKDATPVGTFTLQCAAQSIRMGINAYAAHDTTGQQPVSFTTFAGPSIPASDSATFTVNGTVATGAHIKGQCNVSAVSAEQSSIRLWGQAIIELAANSPSD